MKVNKVLFNSSQNLFLSLHCNGQSPESGSLPLPPPACCLATLWPDQADRLRVNLSQY